MPKYENYKCPVCNEQFTEDDDIVTCPECGTPHHRECYNLSGHCVNQGLHASGYNFLDNNKKEEEKPIIEKTNIGEYYIPNTNAENGNNKEDTKEDKQENTNQYSPFGNIQFNTKEEEKGEIEGVAISDISATIRNNAPKFISKFKNFSHKKKKLSWNWCAFIFGPYYLLFRKMYKQGIAFLCVQFSASLVMTTLLYKFAPDTISKINEVMQNYYSSFSVANTNIASDLSSASDFSVFQEISFGALAVLILLRVIQALFADYFYKGTVFNIIKKVENQIENGASFSQPTILFGSTQELDSKQMRRIYLANKGGVTFFAPLMAYFALELFSNVLTNFANFF